MAKLPSAPVVSSKNAKLSSFVGQLPLSRLLVDLKVARAKQRRSHNLGGKEYVDFADVVCKLYVWLDEHSIADIEKAVR